MEGLKYYYKVVGDDKHCSVSSDDESSSDECTNPKRKSKKVEEEHESNAQETREAILKFLLWRDERTIRIFVALQLVLLIFIYWEYSVLAITSRIIQIFVISFFVVILIGRTINHCVPKAGIAVVKYHKEKAQLYRAITMVTKSNMYVTILQTGVDLLLCKNMYLTAAFIIFLEIVCQMANTMKLFTCIYIICSASLLGGAFMSKYEEKIQTALDLLEKKIPATINAISVVRDE